MRFDLNDEEKRKKKGTIVYVLGCGRGDGGRYEAGRTDTQEDKDEGLT